MVVFGMINNVSIVMHNSNVVHDLDYFLCNYSHVIYMLKKYIIHIVYFYYYI